MARLRPQGMVLVLFGDYVRHRSHAIWVNSLIQIMKNFALSEQAIRSSLSRMSRKGLLQSQRLGKKSCLSLTHEGNALLDKGGRRIFRRSDTPWDNTWHIVVYSIPEEMREARDNFRKELSLLGFGLLNNATWISPWELTKEVKRLAQSLGVADYVHLFKAQHLGFATSKQLVARCWDLKRIHQRYADFVAENSFRLKEYKARLGEETLTPAQCFVERFMLLYEYRRIPFFDPDLPLELLPSDWLRSQTAALFRDYYDWLGPKANQYFDSVYLPAPPVEAKA